MARPRAEDYDTKRKTILDASARLFAAQGFDRASMAQIAQACGVSKALLYHYYKSKDILLYDIIHQHLKELNDAVEAADNPALSPRARLRALCAALLEAYRDSDSQHKIQINEMAVLPNEQQIYLKSMERTLVRHFACAVEELHPELIAANLIKPVTMSLFGMLNWHYLWFRPEGPMTRDMYAELATHLIVEGAKDLAHKELV